jgi:opacity protein-like surface antigen
MAYIRLFHILLAATIALLAALPATEARAQNGLKIGIFLQGLYTDMNIDEFEVVDPGPPPTLEFETGTSSIDAFGFGVSLGKDFRVGDRWVLGIEADASMANDDGNYDGSIYGTSFLATIRGRLGIMAREDLLLYATGGVAWLGVDYTGDVAPPPPMMMAAPPVVLNLNEVLTGWTVGAGAEWDTGVYRLFFEYLYADFEDWKFNVGNEPYDIDTDSHVVRIGIKIPGPDL